MARFSDDNYRNWLKTTETLNTLRVGLRAFLENETETYHNSLQDKLGNRLKGATCQNKCDGRQWQNKAHKPSCKVCTQWSEEILANHSGAKSMVYWKNCLPHLWPKEKWEVAKVHMPKGHHEHTIYDHFDISALLNLMGHCKHFRKFVKDQHTSKVINVRNCVMHSPDFTMSQQHFQQHLENIKGFAHLLEQHVHELKMLPSEIEKIIDTVDNGLGQVLQQHGALQQKCMEMEQKALREKIEFLTQRYEEDQDGVKEEIEGIKTFLQKNKDLKEKLAPQLEQLQRRVDEHDKQINILNERVDQLEVKVTQGPRKDPLFSMNPMKYKNYVFELARKYGWPDPVFTESLEGDGYRGHLEVNGLTFTGEQECLNKKLAHQEVAKKALDHLQTLAPSAEVHTGEEQQTKHPVLPSESSTSEGQDQVKTASRYYYGSVIVVLNTEVASEEGCGQEKEAIDAAYGKLAHLFGLDEAKTGSSKQGLVLEHFQERGFPPPEENSSKGPDEKFYCKLKLCDAFTFHDQEGSTKKRQAEQQAAKTALQQLSRVLNWTARGENYKGDLKERLEAQGLGQPSYDFTKKENLPGGERGRSVALVGCVPAGSSSMNLPPGGTSAPNSIDQPSAAELKPQPTKPDPVVGAPVIPTAGPSTPHVHRKQAKLQFQGGEVERLLAVWGLLPPVVTCEKYSMEQRFTCSVSVQLDGYTFRSSGCCRSKKEASRKAFHSFALATRICQPGADETRSTQEVKQYFAKRSLPCPIEEFSGKENAFSCSLTNVSCNLVYDGQGSSEENARQAAFHDALTKLSQLFGLLGIPGAQDKVDEQVTALLKVAGQGDPAYSLKAQQYKASIQLKFTDYHLEHKSNTNKKQARNYLSERILKMLGVDTDASTSGSLRNSLDEWCKQKKLPEPKFEEMKELLGVRVTFSGPFSCSSPDWEDSWQQAEQSLLQELTARLSWNKEDGSRSGSSCL